MKYTPQARAQNHAMEHHAPRSCGLSATNTQGRMQLGEEVARLLGEPVWAQRAGVDPSLPPERQHDAGWALWQSPEPMPPLQRLAAGVLAYGISYRDPVCWIRFLRCLGAFDLPRAQELAKKATTPEVQL